MSRLNGVHFNPNNFADSVRISGDHIRNFSELRSNQFPTDQFPTTVTSLSTLGYGNPNGTSVLSRSPLDRSVSNSENNPFLAKPANPGSGSSHDGNVTAPHVASVKATKPADPTQNVVNVFVTNSAYGFLKATGLPSLPDLLHPAAVGLYNAMGVEPVTDYQRQLKADGVRYIEHGKTLLNPANWGERLARRASEVHNNLLEMALNHIRGYAEPYRVAHEIASGQSNYKERISGAHDAVAKYTEDLRNGNLETVSATGLFAGMLAGFVFNPNKSSGNLYFAKQPFNPKLLPHQFDPAHTRLLKESIRVGRDSVSIESALNRLASGNFGTARVGGQLAQGGSPLPLSQDIILALEQKRFSSGDQEIVKLLNVHLAKTGEHSANNRYLKDYRDNLVQINTTKTPVTSTITGKKLDSATPPRDVYVESTLPNGTTQFAVQGEFKGAKLSAPQQDEMGHLLAGLQTDLKNSLPGTYEWRGNSYSVHVASYDDVGQGIVRRGDIPPNTKSLEELTGQTRADAADLVSEFGGMSRRVLFGDPQGYATLKNTNNGLDGWAANIDLTRIRFTTDGDRITGVVVADAVRLHPPVPGGVINVADQAVRGKYGQIALSTHSFGYGKDISMHTRSFDRIGDAPGTTTIYAHGLPGGRIGLGSGKTEAEIFSESISAKELAQVLKAEGRNEKPVRLMTCHGADRGLDGSPSAAEVLARELGVPVIAGKGDVNPFFFNGPAAEKGVYMFTPVKNQNGTTSVVIESLDTKTFP